VPPRTSKVAGESSAASSGGRIGFDIAGSPLRTRAVRATKNPGPARARVLSDSPTF
jgi:hypothetical protein